MEQYLSTSYRPDCEYLDGAVVERKLGESDHSLLHAAIAAYFFHRERVWNLQTLVEQRVQVKPDRFRVPDICVVLGRAPLPPILREPPFICIEILSREDTVLSLQDRVDNYLAFGVPNVWAVNPRSRQGYVYTAEGSRIVRDGILRTENPELVVPLHEVFQSFE